MRKNLLGVLSLIFLLGGLAQCGGSSALSGDVKFKVQPTDPVVVTKGDFTLNPGLTNELVIKAPWFEYRSSVENKSGKTLYLFTYSFKGTGVKNGGTVTYEATIDPSKSCDTSGSTRAYLAVIPDGGRYRGLADLTGCDYTDLDADNYETWYMYGLPEADTAFYNINVTGEGWFVDSDGVPIERLNMFGYITTK